MLTGGERWEMWDTYVRNQSPIRRIITAHNDKAPKRREGFEEVRARVVPLLGFGGGVCCWGWQARVLRDGLGIFKTQTRGFRVVSFGGERVQFDGCFDDACR